MRILAIRGENLASLSAPFEISLQDEPLASAGLFAITGETGAGKSTILDALCLALYGEYPRVTNTPREKVPDPSGEGVTLQDSRSLLRRGAVSGFAEVDFLAKDGETYRARWEVRRARNRANGKLQSETRILLNLRDGSAVATGISPVKEAVIARTDLTFEQFRRTVLLAQGEFDTFLLAGKKERAELLEKITGTEIYARISLKVFDGHRTRSEALARLQEKQREIGLLTPDERQALDDTIAHFAAEVDALEKQRATHEATLANTTRLEKATENLSRAEEALAAAQTAKDNASALYSRQAEWEAAEPLRPLLREMQRTTGECQRAEQTMLNTQSALAQAQELSRLKAGELEKAQAAFLAIKLEIETFTPLWREAEKLDHECKTALTTQGEATRKTGEMRTAFENAKEKLDKLSAALETAEAERNAIADYLEQHAHHKPLAENRTAIAEHGAAFTDAHNKHAETRHLLDSKQQEQATAQAAEQAAIQALEAAKQQHEKHAQALSDLHHKQQAFNETDLLAQETHLRNRSELLGKAHRLAENHSSAAAALERAQNAEKTAQDIYTTAQKSIETAATSLIALEAQQNTARKAADLAEASASAHASALRSHLERGEPCPVCGSVEHPLHESDNALLALSTALKAERDAITQQALDTHKLKSEAEGQAATACDRIMDAQTHAQESRDLLSKLEAAYTALQFDAPNGLPPLEAQTLSLVQAAQETCANEMRTLATTLEQCRTLRQNSTKLQQHVNNAYQEIARCTEANIQATKASHQLNLQHAQLADALHRAETDTAITLKKMAPYLAAAGIENTAFQNNTEAAQRTMADMGTAYQENSDNHQRVEAAIQTLLAQQPLLETAANKANAEFQTAQQRETTCREDYTNKITQRQALLGGQETDAHRSAMIARCNECETQKEQCSTAFNDLKNQETAAAERSTNATAVHAEQQNASANARTAFEQACAKQGRDAHQIEAVLSISDEERNDTRNTITQLSDWLNNALINRNNRQKDAQDAASQCDPAANKEDAQRESAALKEQITACLQNIGAEKQKKQRDDNAQNEHRAMADTIAEKAREVQEWNEVSAAIGSANGDRFRTFVQGITLDHMLVLANQHLEALNPRYSLVQGQGQDAELALHIIDRDMGDAVRGTRSLSGGERFLVSLALALALSSLEGRTAFVDTLFIDEGFGSLDAETLDMAMDALETLHHTGRKVGVITHVAAMIERIAVQIRVEKRGGGLSMVSVTE